MDNEADFMDFSGHGVIVITALLLIAPCVAVTVIVVLALTAFGVKLYEAWLAFAGMVTLVPAGIALPSELDRETATPVGPATPRSETAAVPLVPLRIDIGDTEMADRVAAFMVSMTALDTEPSVAVTVVLVSEVIGAGVKEYVALLAPAAIVTAVPAGIVVPFVLTRATLAPLGPALPLSVTIALAFAPP